MYRYEVTSSVKSDIEGVVGKPVFYDDGGKYYINEPIEQIAIQYYQSSSDSYVSETLDQICQDLYSSDFSANSTKLEYVESGIDPDTGGQIVTTKTVPEGWAIQQFETEYKTSALDSIHEKDSDNNDIGWTSLKFYEGSHGSETEITSGSGNLNQTYLDSNCTMTDVYWHPDEDFIIFGGYASQLESPSEDVYSWTGAPALYDAYGGVKHWYTQGGINLRFQDAKFRHGVEKQSGTKLYYRTEIGHPSGPQVIGANRFVFRFRHSAGYKLRLQSLFIIAREIT